MGVGGLIRNVLSSLGWKLKAWGTRIRGRLGAGDREGWSLAARKGIESEAGDAEPFGGAAGSSGPPPDWAERVSRGPPSHWVELVRSRAPQLLRPDSSRRGITAGRASRGPSPTGSEVPPRASPEPQPESLAQITRPTREEKRRGAPPATRAIGRGHAEPPDRTPLQGTKVEAESFGHGAERREELAQSARNDALDGSATPSRSRVARRRIELGLEDGEGRIASPSTGSDAAAERHAVGGEPSEVDESPRDRRLPPTDLHLAYDDSLRKGSTEPTESPRDASAGFPVSRSAGSHWVEHRLRDETCLPGRDGLWPPAGPPGALGPGSHTAEPRDPQPDAATDDLACRGARPRRDPESPLVESTGPAWNGVLDDTQFIGWASAEGTQIDESLWPDLPDADEADHDPVDDWTAALRQWKRQHRLDSEQRGSLWSA